MNNHVKDDTLYIEMNNDFESGTVLMAVATKIVLREEFGNEKASQLAEKIVERAAALYERAFFDGLAREES